jgi:hypothetical protein
VLCNTNYVSIGSFINEKPTCKLKGLGSKELLVGCTRSVVITVVNML